MLVIHPSQMGALARGMVRNFQNQMAAHLKEFAPTRAGRLNDAQLDAIVAAGIERSRSHGFSARGPVQLFLEMIFILGSEFDSDPQYQWAADVLAGTEYKDEMAKAEALHTKLVEYLQRVIGPEDAQLVEVVLRAKKLGPARLAQGVSNEAALLVRLRQLYPAKCEMMGETALHALLRRAAEGVKTVGLTLSLEHVAAFAFLSLVLGHRFPTDPLYPWVKALPSAATIERLWADSIEAIEREFAPAPQPA